MATIFNLQPGPPTIGNPGPACTFHGLAKSLDFIDLARVLPRLARSATRIIWQADCFDIDGGVSYR
jgi:hypothetical protein